MAPKRVGSDNSTRSDSSIMVYDTDTQMLSKRRRSEVGSEYYSCFKDHNSLITNWTIAAYKVEVKPWQRNVSIQSRPTDKDPEVSIPIARVNIPSIQVFKRSLLNRETNIWVI